MIYNQDNAIREFCKKIDAKVVADFNKGRHKLVEDKNEERYYCVYKREFFNKFGVIFKSFADSYPHYSGIGETLNVESINKAIEYNATTLVFIHPDNMYKVYTKQFMMFAVNNNLKRTQIKDNANYGRVINEKTLSIPKEMLKCVKI